jgi:hypothetical protein
MSPSARSGPGLPNRNDETGCHESEDEGGTSSKEDEIEKAQKRCWSKKHQSDVRDNSHVAAPYSTNMKTSKANTLKILNQNA